MKKQKMKGIYCVKMEGLRRGRGGHNEAQRKKKQHVLANMERTRKGRQKSAGLLVILALGGHASGETVIAKLPTISTSCGMASGVKIDMRPPSGEMAKGGGINKRSRDVRKKKNKWSGKTEEKKVMRRKKATEAQRVSRARQTPE